MVASDILDVARRALRARIEGASMEEQVNFKGMDLADRLRWAIDWVCARYQGFTRVPQAERTGTTPQTLSNIVTRRVKNPRYEVLAAIAKDLGVPLQWLINGETNFANDRLNLLIREMPEDMKRTIVNAEPGIKEYLNAGVRLAIAAYEAGIPVSFLQKGFDVARTLNA